MGRESRKIVISGYYGYENSGDEAVLRSILTALEMEGSRLGTRVEPIVLSANPEATSRMYGVRAEHRYSLGAVRKTIRESDGLISGGGSLLQDATSWKTIPYYLAVIKLAQWHGKPTFVYSQGVGPIHRKAFYPWVRRILGRCAYVSVRDQESAEFLRSIGMKEKPIEVVPDPVMGLTPAPAEGLHDQPNAAPRIGVSVRFWRQDRAELKALAEALHRLQLQEQVRFVFLPFHEPNDTDASNLVMDEMKRLGTPGDRMELVTGTDDPQRMLYLVSTCSLLVGMRLHSLIYAASQCVPMLGISYDPKIDQFLNRLNMQPVATTEHIQPSYIADACRKFLYDKEAWTRQTAPLIDQLKQEAMRPANAIIRFFQQKG